MIYNSISIKNVIARVIRNLDNKLPGHYLDYMLEWIPEAMEELKTPFQLVTTSTPNEGLQGALVTKNHVVKLPCGLQHIIAVEDAYGNRVREAGDVTDMTSSSLRYSQGEFGATSSDFHKDPSLGIPWDGSDIVAVTGSYAPMTYKIQMGSVQTSLEEAFIKIHYKALPVDEEGYPLVPDLTEYKEALYWYIMGKLVGAGFKHPVIPSSIQGIEYCEQKFSENAGRALGKIKMPTQDRMARLRDGFAQRMVPPNHFYEDFGIGSEQIQPTPLGHS